MKKTLTIFSVAIAVLLNSCSKPKDGETGAAGPKGNANVISQIQSVSAADWTNNTFLWYTAVAVPSLTATTQSGGAVEVFYSKDAGVSWLALPYTAISSTNYVMDFYTNLNKVIIEWKYNGVGVGSDPNTFFNVTTLKFKIVVIPPGLKNVTPGNGPGSL